MTIEYLRELIDENFETKRRFINRVNTMCGENVLSESVLSNQLSGRVGLTKAWRFAYYAFFQNLQKEVVIDLMKSAKEEE